MDAGLELAGRYVLEELLGFGGMGEVWRGTDRQLDRQVAVKVMRERLANPDLIRRFQREARIAARLQHPGITVVHDVGSHEGQPFIVMELLHGRDLASMLAEAPGGLPVDTALALAIQAAEALQAAHSGHVIHRDLKPANLFLLDTGQVKICDFGIARAADATAHLTVTGQPVGTPAYMSPEQCEGKKLDERSDLYALGCVLYALLTGQPPFPAGQPLTIMFQHLHTTPVAPRMLHPYIPAELDGLVLDLLAKNPAERPSNAGYVAAKLNAFRRLGTTAIEKDKAVPSQQPAPVLHPSTEVARTAYGAAQPGRRYDAPDALAAAGEDRIRVEQLIKDAEEAAHGLVDETCRAKALAEVAMACTEIDAVDAKRLLDDAEKAARLVPHRTRRADALADVVGAYTNVDIVRAEQIASGIIDGSGRDRAHLWLAKAYATVNPARAERIAADIEPTPGWGSFDPLAIVAAACIGVDPVRAERLVRASRDAATQADVFASLAEMCADEDPAGAERLINDAEQAANAISGTALQALALSHAAKACAGINPTHAIRLIDDAEKASRVTL